MSEDVKVLIDITGSAANLIDADELDSVVQNFFFEPADRHTADNIASAISTRLVENIGVSARILTESGVTTINISANFV